jgi:small subunit ribosomal protein S8
MDTIADMLTRIRNAVLVRKRTVEVPFSKVNKEIARILLEEGYINNFEVIEEASKKMIRIALKYIKNEPIILGLKRVSKPSLRKYVGVKDIPSVYGGRGITILSTPKGIMVDRDARKNNVGGEVICQVW